MPGDAANRQAALAGGACFLIVFAVGAIAYGIWGVHASYPGDHTAGPLGEWFGATAYRWDSNWYTQIAEHGYGSSNVAFFPLYPLLMATVGWPVGSPALGGLLVSAAATFAALSLLYRLTRIELGAAAARRVVWIMALFPTAVFLPAVMTEALFLALSVGAFYSARTGRWGWAVGLAAAAALTRNTGVLLVVPIALLYLYGPRADRAAGAPARPLPKPRFAIGREAALVFLIPAALGAFLLFAWIEFGDPLATWHAQGVEWDREFRGPLGAVPPAAADAWNGLTHLTGGLSGVLSYGDPAHAAFRSIREIGWFVFAVVGLVGVLRWLPPAYGAYAGLAMLVPLSTPAPDDPLASFSRYLLVLFPLHMFLAAWTSTRLRLACVLIPSAGLLILYTVELANGRWV
jgi:Mannosyltransferase (PIG-V)